MTLTQGQQKMRHKTSINLFYHYTKFEENQLNGFRVIQKCQSFEHRTSDDKLLNDCLGSKQYEKLKISLIVDTKKMFEICQTWMKT